MASGVCVYVHVVWSADKEKVMGINSQGRVNVECM